jgi:hypothetical protein
MTTSQADVDKVMAAFGAAPIAYRPNQEVAARPDSDLRADATAGRAAPAFPAPPSASARAADRILPGAGGRVREIFPLLWRAIPIVGDLKIGAIKRAGDEVPDAPDPASSAEAQLVARLQAAGTATGPASATAAVEGPAEAPAPAAAEAPPATAVATGPRLVQPPPGDRRAAGAPAAGTEALRPAARLGASPVWPFAARGETPGPAEPRLGEPPPAPWTPQSPASIRAVPTLSAAAPPLAPLATHADLVRPLPRRAPATEPPAPVAAAPHEAAEAAPRPPAPQPAAPQPAAPQPAPPQMPPPAYQGAPQPAVPYPPPPQGYPAYYPAPVPPPYPMHPAAMGWPQPGYPPPYGPAYPMPGSGYPPNYPAAYPPPYPYGYPPQPQQAGPQPGYGAPQPYPMPPEPPPQTRYPAPATEAAGVPPAAPAAAAPTSLSDIFAALHRAPSAKRGDQTPS